MAGIVQYIVADGPMKQVAVRPAADWEGRESCRATWQSLAFLQFFKIFLTAQSCSRMHFRAI
jgi:hypothetical protein